MNSSLACRWNNFIDFHKAHDESLCGLVEWSSCVKCCCVSLHHIRIHSEDRAVHQHGCVTKDHASLSWLYDASSSWGCFCSESLRRARLYISQISLMKSCTCHREGPPPPPPLPDPPNNWDPPHHHHLQFLLLEPKHHQQPSQCCPFWTRCREAVIKCWLLLKSIRPYSLCFYCADILCAKLTGGNENKATRISVADQGPFSPCP